MNDTTTWLGGLVAELRRRQVTRVAMVYAGVAWLVVQVAQTWIPALLLPDWTVTLVALLAALGFPVALVLAWALEITPTGIQRTQPMVVGRGKGSRAGAGAGATPGEGDAQASPRSIAVLPFANLSGDTDQEYLSDGIAEELLNALARVEGLRVVSRTSSFAFRGKLEDVRHIGEVLGVDNVLEGSVRRVGDRVRIRAQLTDVRDGFLVWSDIYERAASDLFELQDEIARSIIEALQTRFPELVFIAPAARSAQSGVAYELYLQGRFLWNKRTPEGLGGAVQRFQAAIAADPTLAAAHAGLADAYLLLVDYGLRSPASALPGARTAVESCLRLDGASAEGYTSLALVEQFEWNWAAADTAFRRAIALNPGYATVHQRYALFLAWMGRTDEAGVEIERALRLEPTSSIVRTTAGLIRYYARDFAGAIDRLREALELDRGFAMAHTALGMAYAHTARHEAAVEQYEIALGLTGESAVLQALLAHALGGAGNTAAAEARLQPLLERENIPGEFVPPYYVALAHVGLSQTERAMQCLERAYRHRSNHLIYLKTDPMMDALRSDARFTALLGRLELDA